MLAGTRLEAIVAASATLTEYGIPDPAAGRIGEAAVIELCKVVHKHGLHEQLLEASSTAGQGSDAPAHKVTLSCRSHGGAIERPKFLTSAATGPT